MLRSGPRATMISSAEAILVSLGESMASKLLPEKFGLEWRAFEGINCAGDDAPRRAVDWVLVEEAHSAHPGLIRTR